ncbi:MAG: hypothetical protein K9J83_06630 [Desulfarculaceae bacterium]|nr:hypothetical protein [Desulfarculaceae bacterium]
MSFTHALEKKFVTKGNDWAGSKYRLADRTPYGNWFRKTTSSLIVTLVDD